ncbi:TPA: hypothetical protein ACXIMI_002314 [Stenotrophomonas maltophilia]
MSNDARTLADARPGGRVRLGDQALITNEGARSYVADFFATQLRRHDFGDYILTELAADFACALAQHLSAQPSPGGQGNALPRALEDLRDALQHVIDCADGGDDYSCGRPMIDAMTTLGLMRKTGRGLWSVNVLDAQAVVEALAARQPVYVQGSDELRARTEGERAAYMEGLEEGKKIAARQPVGEPVAVAYGPISLPPVPHGQVMPPDDRSGLYPVAHDDEAMQDYAREAVEADREQLAAGIAHVKGAVLIEGTVHLVRKGDEIDWANGSVDGRKGRLLYSAPPAQAVDLGAVRYALDAAEGLAVACASVDGFSREEIASAGREMRKQFADARALIDSQAVGNG